MQTEQYQVIYEWFQNHPWASALLRLAYRMLDSVFGFLYLSLVSIRLYTAMTQYIFGKTAWQAAEGLVIAVGVPAVVVVLGTIVRAVWNCPRPYEQEGFVPLIGRSKTGHACPSRHAISASVIATVWCECVPTIGMLLVALALVLSVVRVLAGVHSVRDILVGLAFGFGLGLVGIVGVKLFW